ncbi:MAG: substrate-binding domain-containing protein [Muribaculaceae bacterium]|nr:substrate-binding domain-containing protein [Muribaculaceae bacterium]
MKQLRHYVPLLIIITILTACKKDPSYRIGVSQCSEDDWRTQMNEQIEREIMFNPGATVEIRSAADSSNRQIRDIEYFIDEGFDIIIAAPNEAEALTPVIKKAYDRGIPVLVFDREVLGDDYTAFQGADNASIGREAARYALAKLPGGGSVIELQGLPGSTPAAGRSRGFRQELDSLGAPLKVVASAPANWNYEEAVNVADSLLALHPDAQLIYAHNDRMAIGAAEAAEARGLNPFIIGIDGASAIGMKAVKEGKIDATFFYPTEGGRLVKTAMAILKGEPYPQRVLLPTSPAIDSSNIDLLLSQTEIIDEETRQMRALKTEVDDYWNRHNSQTAFLYASIAVLVLLCILLFVVLRNFWQNRRHHAQLAAATHSKLVFFTNVSHDLRTPLTLIAEPVEQMAGAPNLTDRQKTLMRIADKNIKILRRLINQILDFRKFENDRLTLNLEETRPGEIGGDWAAAFSPLAAKKHMDYEVDIDLPEGFSMAMDVEKVERVVFNLLSNAFKFTPVKGKVKLAMQLYDGNFMIKVSDSGRGISQGHLDNIFARFYQVDNVRPEGSGIGLSLVKAFVELHDGKITVESTEGRGSVFTVSLPVTHVENAASEDVLEQSRRDVKTYVAIVDTVDDSVVEVREEDTGGKPLLLVIDDNEDVRLMIRELVGDTYRVIGASDGSEGIRMATRYVPDLIICDVMMPGTDGIETCKALKSEISTSHIPVLMLTACSMDEQRVEGYESGADGYMAKPFNSEVLKARLKSLLANRRLLLGRNGDAPRREAATDSKGAPARQSRPGADMENEFYNRFLALFNSEMGNMDITVDSIAEKMGMGRSQFYRKIKALTNLSPVELMRDLRLKRARDMLLTSDKSISEIAYEVGFSTPAYFTKCYREVYSETPTALRERMRG